MLRRQSTGWRGSADDSMGVEKRMEKEADRLREMISEADSIADKEALHDGAKYLRMAIPRKAKYSGRCPACGDVITLTANFCKRCGRAWIWEGWN